MALQKALEEDTDALALFVTHDNGAIRLFNEDRDETQTELLNVSAMNTNTRIVAISPHEVKNLLAEDFYAAFDQLRGQNLGTDRAHR